MSNAGIPTVKKITDLYAIKKSGFYYYDAGAFNAPMSSRGGMVIANYSSDAWISLNVVPYESSKIYTNSKYNSTWTGWSELASKSDLTGIDAALSIREENGGVIVSFSSKDSKYGIYIGVGPNGVNVNYKLNGEWKKAIIIATQS